MTGARDDHKGRYDPYDDGKESKGYPVHKIAGEILDANEIVASGLGNKQKVYIYHPEHGYWREMPDGQVLQMALHFDENEKVSTAAKRANVMAHIIAKQFAADLTWGRVAEDHVPTLSGVVDVRDGTVHPHAPDNFLERVVPWPYDPAAQCPNWEGALADFFGDGESDGRYEALQEFFGYIVLQHARYKKAAILKGPSNCGKSLVVKAAIDLAGFLNTCSLPVDKMDDPVLRVVLKGKALNTMTELSSGAMIADGGFKTLVSTEEPILINEKFHAPELYLPTAKHLIATNTLPYLSDQSEATFNRLLIVKFDRVFSEDEQDPQLSEAIKEEMPGVLRWAIEGARRLVSNDGRFTDPESSRQLLDEYRDSLSPMKQFVAECLERDPRAAVPTKVIAHEYNKWIEGGRRLSPEGAGRALTKVGLETKRKRSSGAQIRCLWGFRLIDEGYQSVSGVPVRLDLSPEEAVEHIEGYDDDTTT